MRSFTLVIIAIALASFVFGCGSEENASLAVAKDFWKALEDRDIDRAKTFATSESANALTVNEEQDDQDVDISFGKIEIEDGKSSIETNMRSTGGDMDMDIPMKTVLVKEEGEWKVDVNLTMMSLFGGAMGAMMETMKEGMEEMSKAMSKADGQ